MKKFALTCEEILYPTSTHIYGKIARLAKEYTIYGKSELLQVINQEDDLWNWLYEDGNTVLHILIINNQYEAANAHIMKLLKTEPKKMSTYIHICNHKGNTVLHEAVNVKNYYLIKLVLDMGVDMMIVNKEGLTAYDLSTKYVIETSSAIMLLLIKHQLKEKYDEYLNEANKKLQQFTKDCEENNISIIKIHETLTEELKNKKETEIQNIMVLLKTIEEMNEKNKEIEKKYKTLAEEIKQKQKEYNGQICTLNKF